MPLAFVLNGDALFAVAKVGFTYDAETQFRGMVEFRFGQPGPLKCQPESRLGR